jgi:hypothetical protein
MVAGIRPVAVRQSRRAMERSQETLWCRRRPTARPGRRGIGGDAEIERGERPRGRAMVGAGRVSARIRRGLDNRVDPSLICSARTGCALRRRAVCESWGELDRQGAGVFSLLSRQTGRVRSDRRSVTSLRAQLEIRRSCTSFCGAGDIEVNQGAGEVKPVGSVASISPTFPLVDRSV